MKRADFNGRVMVLPLYPTIEQVQIYLMWLASSKFEYHIDEDPYDIIFKLITPTNDELDQLSVNADRMFSMYNGDFIWDNYRHDFGK